MYKTVKAESTSVIGHKYMRERSIHLDGTRVLHKSCRPRTSDWQLGFQSRGL